MSRLLRALATAILLLALAACEPPPPYDESADAERDVAGALARASAEQKLVMITFGANWCSDCRAFARAIEAPEVARGLAERFVSVKVDVGNWDRNPGVVEAWGNPVAEGIPALVVATPEREILYATRRGQISSAAKMSPPELAAFFDELSGLGRVTPRATR